MSGSRDLDASVRAIHLQGLRLEAIGDAYRRHHAWSSVDGLTRLRDGTLAALSYRDVSIWDVDEDREVRRFKTPHTPKAVSFDGSRYLLDTTTLEGSRWTDDDAWLWSPDDGRLATLEGVHEIQAEFFPDGSFSTASRGTIRRFDASGAPVGVAELPDNGRGPLPWFVTPFVAFPDGTVAGIGHRIQSPALLFTVGPDGALRHRPLPAGIVSALARNRDELLLPSREGLHRFDLATLEPRGLHAVPERSGGVRTIGADDAGVVMASDAVITMVDFATGEARFGAAPPYSVSNLVFLGDGRRIAGAGIGGTIHLWDRTTGEELAPVEHVGEVRCLLPLGAGALAAGRGGSSASARPPRFSSFVDVCDGESVGRLRRIECGTGGGVISIAAAADGAIAAMTWDGRVTVAPVGGDVFTLPAPYADDEGERGAGVLWRSNGELVALHVRVAVRWDVTSRTELARDERPFGTITSELFPGSWETEDTDFPDELLGCSPGGALGVTSVIGDARTEASWLFDGTRRETFATGRAASAAAVDRTGSWAAIAFGSSVEIRAPGESAPRSVASFASSVNALAISPDGRHWAAALASGRMEIRVGASEAPSAWAELAAADDRANALAFLADGSLVAGTRRGNLLRFRTLE